MKYNNGNIALVFIGVLFGLALLFGGSHKSSVKSAESAEPQANARDMRGEQVKIFANNTYSVGSWSYTEENNLESIINVWLSSNNGKIEIVRVLQSQGDIDSYVTLSIFYKKTE
jgi:hypothetical protein